MRTFTFFLLLVAVTLSLNINSASAAPPTGVPAIQASAGQAASADARSRDNAAKLASVKTELDTAKADLAKARATLGSKASNNRVSNLERRVKTLEEEGRSICAGKEVVDKASCLAALFSVSTKTLDVFQSVLSGCVTISEGSDIKAGDAKIEAPRRTQCAGGKPQGSLVLRSATSRLGDSVVEAKWNSDTVQPSWPEGAPASSSGTTWQELAIGCAIGAGAGGLGGYFIGDHGWPERQTVEHGKVIKTEPSQAGFSAAIGGAGGCLLGAVTAIVKKKL
jgi:hypothetical protein